MSKRTMAMCVAVVVLQSAFGPVLRAQGPREGIKVHGHWAIDVRQPDGTLVSHTEFENAIVPLGLVVLNGVLTRQATMGKWVVNLPNAPCFPPLETASCFLSEPPSFNSSDGITAGPLEVSMGDNWSLVLRGSFTAQRTGAISVVYTMARLCLDSSVAPANCDGVTLYPFSGTSLAPVAVTSGQIVQITVTLSFS